MLQEVTGSQRLQIGPLPASVTQSSNKWVQSPFVRPNDSTGLWKIGSLSSNYTLSLSQYPTVFYLKASFAVTLAYYFYFFLSLVELSLQAGSMRDSPSPLIGITQCCQWKALLRFNSETPFKNMGWFFVRACSKHTLYQNIVLLYIIEGDNEVRGSNRK